MTQWESVEIRRKAGKIRLLLLDVDGVLTEGQVIYDADGREIKAFHVKDGLGIRLLIDNGTGVGIITGRSSEALLHRCRNLGIEMIFDGIKDKAALLDRIAGQTGISRDEMAFVGDDLPDFPVMQQVGLSVAVADAHPLLLEHADAVTIKKGGQGAVREVCEQLLAAQEKWESIKEKYLIL